MKISGDYTFNAPRDKVWSALFDPEILASVMPGCEKLELVGEQEYEGLLKIKVGPVQGKFNGKIKLHDIVEPDSYQMEIDGRGAPGFVKAEAMVSLRAEGDQTVLTYDSDAKVGGRVASVGQRLLDSTARAITKQSLEGLAAAVEEPEPAAEDSGASVADSATVDGADGRGARAASPHAASPHSASPRPRREQPSQAEFAANVAKEVVADLVPKPVLYGIVVAVVALIGYFLFA